VPTIGAAAKAGVVVETVNVPIVKIETMTVAIELKRNVKVDFEGICLSPYSVEKS
jgi:hypothetical protein